MPAPDEMMVFALEATRGFGERVAHALGGRRGHARPLYG
jgi:hypothetical protein